MTALHSAAGFNRPDVVKYLLARGAKPTKTDADGQTAHQLASSYGHSAVEAVFKVAEAEGGIENLKIEVLPGYQEEKERRKVADEARKLEKDRRASAFKKEETRQQQDAAYKKALAEHDRQTRERKMSMTVGIS